MSSRWRWRVHQPQAVLEAEHAGFAEGMAALEQLGCDLYARRRGVDDAST